MEALPTWRPFQLDDIALRIGDVDRRAFSLRAVSRRQRAGFHIVCGQLTPNVGFVEGFDAKAEVIEISTFLSGRRTARASELAIHRYEVDQ